MSCHKPLAEDKSPGLFQNGDAVFQAHYVGWILCGCFTAVAVAASLWLINKHLQWYTNKREQRYIVRLLFLVPIYALISLASFLFWNNATPLILVRDAYEAIVLTAFFYLLLAYLSPDPEEQRRIFLKAGLSKANDAAASQRGENPQRWMFPLGFIKKKPKDGLYFLQLMKWGVLQYCVIRPTSTLAAVILDYAGYYCESSWSPAWGHIWIVVIISISVTIAMYCLVQLYIPVSQQLKPHNLILKLFSVKAVVFLTFWQATLLAALSMLGVVKDTRYMTAEDIDIGIGALLECFEMMIFAFVHIKAFSYKPYRPFHNPHSKGMPPARTPRFRSLAHALDFRETFREIWIGCIYMFDKLRGKEPRPDFGVRRAAHYEEAFGQPRPSRPKNMKATEVLGKTKNPDLTPSADMTINQHVEVEVAGERQWLGLGDDYGYGIGYFRRERNEGLSIQIEQELQKRGYSDRLSRDDQESGVSHPRPQPEIYTRRECSWWRNIYEHISQGNDGPDTSLIPSLPRRLQTKSKTRRRSEAQHNLLPGIDPDLEDPPPSSALHSDLPRFHLVTPSEGVVDEGDVLGPLNTYRDRRSYKPKRHRNSGSASLLLPQHPHGPAPPSPPGSSIDMSDLGPRLQDPDSLLSLPDSYYNRSDSLFKRIFPPSEVESVEGRARYETDSAYSLPSVSTEGQHVEGDRRRHVNVHTHHPSHSTHALHAPWTAEVLHHHDAPSHATEFNDYGEPPPLPAKDINYVPSFRRQHRRETPHHRHRPPVDSGASLPSLPEDDQFTPPHPPYLIPKNDTERSSTLIDTPTSPQSAYFSDSRSSWSEPDTPHGKPIRGIPSDTSAPPLPSASALLAAYEEYYARRYIKPAAATCSTATASPADIITTSRKTTSSERADKQTSANVSGEPLPLPRPRNPPPRPPVDSDDLSDVSVNTFYTAASQPRSTHARRS